MSDIDLDAIAVRHEDHCCVPDLIAAVRLLREQRDAARAETAEQIAVAIEPRGTRSTHMIYLHAARIARQHAREVASGDDE